MDLAAVQRHPGYRRPLAEDELLREVEQSIVLHVGRGENSECDEGGGGRGNLNDGLAAFLQRRVLFLFPFLFFLIGALAVVLLSNSGRSSETTPIDTPGSHFGFGSGSSRRLLARR